jgi:hypothetical protein
MANDEIPDNDNVEEKPMKAGVGKKSIVPAAEIVVIPKKPDKIDDITSYIENARGRKREVALLLLNGYSPQDIERITKVSMSHISNIKRELMSFGFIREGLPDTETSYNVDDFKQVRQYPSAPLASSDIVRDTADSLEALCKLEKTELAKRVIMLQSRQKEILAEAQSKGDKMVNIDDSIVGDEMGRFMRDMAKIQMQQKLLEQYLGNRNDGYSERLEKALAAIEAKIAALEKKSEIEMAIAPLREEIKMLKSSSNPDIERKLEEIKDDKRWSKMEELFRELARSNKVDDLKAVMSELRQVEMKGREEIDKIRAEAEKIRAQADAQVREMERNYFERQLADLNEKLSSLAQEKGWGKDLTSEIMNIAGEALREQVKKGISNMKPETSKLDLLGKAFETVIPSVTKPIGEAIAENIRRQTYDARQREYDAQMPIAPAQEIPQEAPIRQEPSIIQPPKQDIEVVGQ